MATAEQSPVATVSRFGRYVILIFAFLGWAFAGVHMSINGIVLRVATADMMSRDFQDQGIGVDSSDEAQVESAVITSFDVNKDGKLNDQERGKAREAVLGQWFGWFVCAFLFGAAGGGYLFGFIGDRFGRAKAMAGSILCYSVFSLVTFFVTDPQQLLVLRFVTCLGIGGMWPNGIALLSEAWADVSRPILAGIMGTAANVGILVFALITILVREVTIVPEVDWRWTFLVGGSPIVLGILSLLLVPESPRWLALQKATGSDDQSADEVPVTLGEIFKPPVLKITVVGILLGTIPLFGGWGVSNWTSAWASEVGDRQQKTKGSEEDEQESAPKKAKADPILKSMTVVARSLPGSISSLLGGALAFWLGRKRTYFLLCIGALICTQFLFRLESPIDSATLFTIPMFGRELAITEYLGWVFGLGFFSGFFFGWLPLCLPEMFSTRIRSTGSGVSFNWGRILTGFGVLASAIALKELFKGDYAQVGRITGFIYAVGLVVIVLAPIGQRQELED